MEEIKLLEMGPGFLTPLCCNQHNFTEEKKIHSITLNTEEIRGNNSINDLLIIMENKYVNLKSGLDNFIMFITCNLHTEIRIDALPVVKDVLFVLLDKADKNTIIYSFDKCYTCKALNKKVLWRKLYNNMKCPGFRKTFFMLQFKIYPSFHVIYESLPYELNDKGFYDPELFEENSAIRKVCNSLAGGLHVEFEAARYIKKLEELYQKKGFPGIAYKMDETRIICREVYDSICVFNIVVESFILLDLTYLYAKYSKQKAGEMMVSYFKNKAFRRKLFVLRYMQEKALNIER